MSGFIGSTILKVIGTQAGIAFALLVLARLFPKTKLRAMTRPAGQYLSRMGRTKWGKKLYEPVETFVQDTLGELLVGFMEGLDEDDGLPDQGMIIPNSPVPETMTQADSAASTVGIKETIKTPPNQAKP